MTMGECTKESGKATGDMEEVMKSSPTVISTMVTIRAAEQMEKECISGKMERCMTESGSWESSKAMESGRVPKVSLT